MEKRERNLALLVNTYYLLAEGNDIILREVERLLAEESHQLKREIKQRHSFIMAKIRSLKAEQEKFFKDYDLAFGTNISKYDNLRHSANYLARICLLIGDRCGEDTSGINEDIVEDFIEKMPQMGFFTDDLKERFYLK